MYESNAPLYARHRGKIQPLEMGKPKNRGLGTEEGADEGDEKVHPAGQVEADISAEKDERRAQVGVAASDPTPTTAPLPAPRKRGRPRKVIPKVEENNTVLPQQRSILATDAESKKPKAESPSATRNGTPPSEQPNIGSKLSTRVPLRREGSRRKSEPRRAAD
ncbi:hypothetical protein L7F22_006463 [Adiantum nelumboides]|nr:hypothetical protein [Adiantum nelumboides]